MPRTKKAAKRTLLMSVIMASPGPLVVGLSLITLGTARGIWIVCENKNAYIKKMVLWGAVLNIVLNVALIPLLGIVGSAITSLTTQIFTSIIAPLLYKETRVHTKYVADAFLLRIK